MHSAACSLAPAAARPCKAQGAARASRSRPLAAKPTQRRWNLVLARAEEEGSSEQATQTPSAQQQQQQKEEEPVWVRRERERQLQKEEGSRDLPFGAYLLFSSFTAIAAVGSIFEYVNQRPIFDVIQPDSPLYAPILGFFAVTGLPTAAFLFIKSVQSANKEAERMDKLDGY